MLSLLEKELCLKNITDHFFFSMQKNSIDMKIIPMFFLFLTNVFLL